MTIDGDWSPLDVRIEVFCDDETSRRPVHRGREISIITFVLRDLPAGSTEYRWGVQPAPTRAQVKDIEEFSENLGYLPPASGRALEATEELWKRAEFKPPVRSQGYQNGKIMDNMIGGDGGKYIMVCGLCHVDEQAKTARVEPILDTLHQHGQSRISLTGIAAILRSSK